MAKHYYKLAIKHNDPYAYYNLGMVYKDEGKLKKAAKLLIESGKLGHDRSLIELLKFGLTINSTDDDIDQSISIKKLFGNFGAYDGW